MMLCLNLPFHIMPISRPTIDENNAWNAIHSAGSCVITDFEICGEMYVASNPEKNILHNNHFWLWSAWIFNMFRIFVNMLNFKQYH